MNASKFIGIAMLAVMLCSFSTATTPTSPKLFVHPTVASSTSTIEGGPRDIIQFMTSVTIVQPQSETLDIVIKLNGAVVHATTTTQLQTNISTSGWSPGDYIVETVSLDNDYQELYFTIE